MRRLLATIVTAAFLFTPTMAANAEIREATYEIQGVEFLAPFNRFPDALLIKATEGQANEIPHMHVQWLINNGIIQSREDLVGQCAIVFSQWVKDEHGSFHQNAYIPKGEMSLRIVSCSDAMGFDPNGRVDGYIEDMDIEGARQKGLGSSGSTPTHEGHRRGAE